MRCNCRPDEKTFASLTEVHLLGQNPVNKRVALKVPRGRVISSIQIRKGTDTEMMRSQIPEPLRMFTSMRFESYRMVLHRAFRARCVRKNGIGGEVRHGVTSGVSCETSLNMYVIPHLHSEYDGPLV